LEAGLQRRSEVAAKVERQAPSSFRGENSGGRCRLHFSKAADTPKMWASRQLQPLASEQYTVLSADENVLAQHLSQQKATKRTNTVFPSQEPNRVVAALFFSFEEAATFPA
jgi:hypothetical protein